MTSPTRPDLQHEYALRGRGFIRIAGLDEAGRGALAGPVVAAAVVLPIDRFDLGRALEGVADSKQLSAEARESLAPVIRGVALDTGLGWATSAEIDLYGLLPATRAAMHRALHGLVAYPAYLLIDHLPLPDLNQPQEAITRGDQSVLSIAAASILAKVARDRHMVELGERYPGYGFENHKGYGTQSHRDALRERGACPVHRRSYAPVARTLH